MNARLPEHEKTAVVFRNLTIYFLFVLLLTACSPSSTMVIPTVLPVQPSGQIDAMYSHPPVILRVEERTETQNGRLFLFKDIYFTDPDGDATTVVNTLVATDPSNFSATVGDDVITAPADEQNQGAMVTSAMRCSSALRPFSLTIEDRIRDAAGNLSEPITIVFACPANPPNSLPYVIVVLVIGFGLLVGLWLYFHKYPAERTPSILSILLLLCALFLIYFIGAIFHEGGHALTNLIQGGTFETFYVHPFAFSDYARPFADNAWFHAGGYILNLLVCFVIFSLLWKRRSIANLPFVMLFPFETFSSGLLILLLNGDITNIMRLTGLPAFLFVALGLALLCLGLLLFFALFPLLGLNPADKKSLLVVPTAFYLHGAISMLVAYVFVPGSSIDNQYLLGADILTSANMLVILLPILGTLFAALYLTLFRKVHSKLPVWLRTETVNLTWKDLRIPGLLCIVSVIFGLIIVIYA